MGKALITRTVKDAIESTGYIFGEHQDFTLPTLNLEQADFVVDMVRAAFNNGYAQGANAAMKHNEKEEMKNLGFSDRESEKPKTPDIPFIATDYRHAQNGSCKTLCGINIDHTIEVSKGDRVNCPRCLEAKV